MQEPVVVRVHHVRALVIGLLTLPLAILACLFAASALIAVGPLDFAFFLSLFLAVSLVLGCAVPLAIGLRRPVALRMDQNGISGYYCDPATWDQIDKVGTFSGQKNRRFLGFALRDPVAFRDMQTPWGRYRSWSLGRGYGYHFAVPQTTIRDADVDALAQTAKTLMAAHDQVT